MAKYPLTASSTGGQKVQVASALGDIDNRLADLELLKLQELGKSPIESLLGWGNKNKGLQWLSILPNVDGIQFNTEYTQDSHTEGLVHWDSSDGTLEVDMPGGQVSLQVGQEMLVRVRNETGATITDGLVVWNTGSSGNKPLIALADALSTSDPRQTGMATEDIAHNDNGYVNLTGMVRGLDTSAHAEGTSLYLSTTPGALTATAPTSPDHVYWIAVVTRQHADEGSVYHKPTMPLNMSSLSDFNGTSPDTTNKHIVWNDAAGYWDADQVSHADLADLAADDHILYLLADGSRGLTGDMAVTALKTIDGRDLSVDGTKLDGIESLADVTDATNVAAAGAAMSGGAFHDGFSDSVANEHVDHTAVVLTGGDGIATLGDISASRTVAVELNTKSGLQFASGKLTLGIELLDTNTPSVDFASDALVLYDASYGGAVKITPAAFEAELNHDSLAGFITNEHIDWTGASAGTIHISNVNVEDGATTDQTDAEIETAYNNQVGAMSQATAEAGTSTTIERVTAERIAQAIAALGGGGGGLAPTSVIRTSDLVITSNTTLQNMFATPITLAANEGAFGHVDVIWSGNTFPDLKFGWSYPSGCQVNWGHTSSATSSTIETQTLVLAGQGAGVERKSRFMFNIRNSSTAGDANFQIAQNLLNAASITIHSSTGYTVTIG